MKYHYYVSILTLNNEWLYITEVDYFHKQWKAIYGEQALPFTSMKMAKELAYCLNINGNLAKVEVFFTEYTPTNNGTKEEDTLSE